MTENGLLSFPELVAKESSIGRDNELSNTSAENGKSNVARNQMVTQQKPGNQNSTYQRFIQGVLKRKMKDSWLNTTYQRAIWNARRRLIRGENIDHFPVEEKDIANGFLVPKMKPDYSKWKIPNKRTSLSLHPSLPKLEERERKHDTTLVMKKRGLLTEHSLHSYNGQLSEVDFEDAAPQIYPVEFISLSDRLALHEPPWLRTLRDGKEVETFDNFGLCFGCFHKRGPHYHYQAPVRTGGGFTIYRRNPMLSSSAGLDDPVWINNQRKSVESLIGTDYAAIWLSDEFTIDLFHAFIDNGGDVNALKEYLESNFDNDVLNDLKLTGVNVQQIEDYTDMLRRYIREKLEKNIEQQKEIFQEKDEDLQFYKWFTKIAQEGGDLEILLAFLEEGDQHKSFVAYEEKGGNVEIIRHYASALSLFLLGADGNQFTGSEISPSTEQEAKRSQLVNRLRQYVERENEHKRASLLLEFMEKGGRLDELLQYVTDRAAGISRSGSPDSLVQQYAQKYSGKLQLLEDIGIFAKKHFKNYSFANLLRKYIESGGKVLFLKQYIGEGCSLSSRQAQKFVEDGGNLNVLQAVGEEIFNDSSMREDLEKFPDDPDILDAYVRRGGNFSSLVSAVTEVLNDPEIERYIENRDHFIRDGKFEFGEREIRASCEQEPSSRIKRLFPSSYPPPNSPHMSEDSRSNMKEASDGTIQNQIQEWQASYSHILTQVIEAARAEFKYDKLVATEELRRKSEGEFLAKEIEFNQIRLTETMRRRKAFRDGHHYREETSVSPITGKRRQRLWKAPKPFMLKRGDFRPTRASSPFSENRLYDLPALSEDRILNVEREQRYERDVLRRNYNSKDFRDKWKVEIRSPDGSMISEHDSITGREFPKTGPVTLKKPEGNSSKIKVSRRDRQRMKMRVNKRKSAPKSGKEASRSRSPSLLSLPVSADDLKPIATMISAAETSSSEADGSRVTKFESEKEKEGKHERSSSPIENENLISASQIQGSSPHNKNGDGLQRKQIESSEEEDENIKRINDEEGNESQNPSISVPSDDEIEIDEAAHFQTAFGKSSSPKLPSKRIPLFPELISNPNTQLEQRDEIREPRRDLSHRVDRMSMKARRPIRSLQKDLSLSMDKSDEELEYEVGSTVEDVLKKYCIIREDRLPRYRHIFDKHIMLMEMREQERSIKAQRVEAARDLHYDDVGPAYEELKKCEFLWDNLSQSIEELEYEIKAARGGLERSRVLAARELVLKIPNLLRVYRKPRRRAATSRTSGTLMRTQQTLDSTEMEMDSLLVNSQYHYNQSARVGFEEQSEITPLPSALSRPRIVDARRTSPRRRELPLQDLDDTEIMSILDKKTKKTIENDPVIQFNHSTIRSLEEKLARLQSRSDKLRVRLEMQRTLAQTEKETKQAERARRQNFVRQQSELFQALHPTDDPVIDIDDVPEALRDVNGQISRRDSAAIFEALDFLRPHNGVNFRVFCILAALSESAKSIQPLVRQLRRTKDAQALSVKIDKCKEIYDNLLGSNIECLQSELRSSGYASPQYYQMVKKLTRDNDGLSFLDFVTYVPLFLDIHQRIVANPLTA